MNHSLDELLEIVYRYYPRGVGSTDPLDIQRRDETEEHARLVAVRRHAAVDERWRAIRSRIEERFPHTLMNHSLHLPTGAMDACYSFTINLPNATDGRLLWFHISFLAPYYLIHSYRQIEIVKQSEHFNTICHGLRFYIQRSAIGPGLISNFEDVRSTSITIERRDVSFDLSPDERPYAEWIAREIETTFGCERMPLEVGTMLVPDVATNMRTLGTARLYDCLFTDNHEWVNRSPSEERAAIEIDASRLTDQFTAVLTVLAAFYHIWYALLPPEMQGYFVASTDGVLRKDEMLLALARVRLIVESPITLRAMAAARELEALIAAWDGKGAPPDAMVAWASGFLANWVTEEN